jgi:hypothetical protein
MRRHQPPLPLEAPELPDKGYNIQPVPGAQAGGRRESAFPLAFPPPHRVP